jgi:glycogen debranching enzyme
VKVARFVGEGMHEELQLTNFTQTPTDPFELEIDLDADFADISEVNGKRQQRGTISTKWNRLGPSSSQLRISYEAKHRYQHQADVGESKICRGLVLRINCDTGDPEYSDGKITFTVRLAPHQSWKLSFELIALYDGKELELGNYTDSFATETRFDKLNRGYLESVTQFRTPNSGKLSALVEAILERAKQDLATLRLYDLDYSNTSWVTAAGLPLYLALFGRDCLSVGWQTLLLGNQIADGTLHQMRRYQGTRIDDWRDEQPGRMLHEAHPGPVSILKYNPRERYYGSITASSFYTIALSEYWHWTGNRETVEPLIEPALQALSWLDNYAKLENSFYGYKTRSEQGVEHQSWKDSGDSMVAEDGSPVKAPIACCEEQGYVYAAKLRMAEMLVWFERKNVARRLLGEANDLRQRFNQKFWMPDLRYFAMGLDSRGRPIRSIASNPLHAMRSGIIDSAHIQDCVERLLQRDLFSGWGIRTLSSDHPAYDPYSYHRGSVWPTEAGAMAVGLKLYGLDDRLAQLCLSQFEAIQLCESYQLPEAFSGHPRDEWHPIPALYPKSCSPQAWSASAVISLVQALLGIYPYAPLNVLLLDPSLPEWLPELTLENLHIGDATLDLRFQRTNSGHTTYQVLNQTGRLDIIRESSPWSVRKGIGTRVTGALSRLLA